MILFYIFAFLVLICIMGVVDEIIHKFTDLRKKKGVVKGVSKKAA